MKPRKSARKSRPKEQNEEVRILFKGYGCSIMPIIQPSKRKYVSTFYVARERVLGIYSLAPNFPVFGGFPY